MTRFVCCFVVLLSFATWLSAQEATPPSPPINSSNVEPPAPAPATPDELSRLLTEAFKQNTFANLDGPYHFLARFETFAPDGQPAGEGSIEKFFAAPGHVKVITRFGGHRMTAYFGGQNWTYTDDGFQGSMMTYFVDDFLLNPVYASTATRKLDTKVMQLQGDELACGMFQFYVEPPGQKTTLPREVFCLSRGTHDLVLRQTLHFSVRYKDFKPFLDRRIPSTISVSEGSVIRARVHLEQLDQQTLEDASLNAPPEATQVKPGPNWWATSAGELPTVKKATPYYPIAESRAHIQGVASFLLLISKKGTVLDSQLLYAPTPAMANSADQAVSKWTFTPLTRDGGAVEAIQRVYVSFTLLNGIGGTP